MEGITIVRSKRRTVAIQIVGGKVIIRAPLSLSQTLIDGLVNKKQSWIAKYLTNAAVVGRKPLTFSAGEQFWLLGNTYPLFVIDFYSRNLKFSGQSFVISKYINSKTARGLFISWYKKQAVQHLSERVKYWSGQMKVEHKKLRITSARTRWGSCSGAGTISFSWRLIMAPLWVIDYVVVHELAHLTYHHHGQLFWSEVEVTCPDWRKARGYLREFSPKAQF